MEVRRLRPSEGAAKAIIDVVTRVKHLETRPSGTIYVDETIISVDPETGREIHFGVLPDGSVGFDPYVNDITPPGKPSTPKVTAAMGGLEVWWDGKEAGDSAQPDDYSHTDIEYSVDGVVWTLGGTFTNANSTVVGNLTVGTTYQIRLISYDKNKNASEPSTTASGVPVSFVDNEDVENALEELRQSDRENASAAAKAQESAGKAHQTATSAGDAALKAAGIANGKGRVIYAPTAPTSADDRNANNLWVDTSGDVPKNTPYRWDATTNKWIAITDKAALDAGVRAGNAEQLANAASAAAAAAAAAAGKAQTSANDKNRVWYLATPPAGNDHKVDDTWFDTSNGNMIHRWTGTEWVTAQDAAIAKADKKAADAAATAAAAGTSASNAATAAENAAKAAGAKGKVIIQNAAPDAADRLAQNLWIDTTGGKNTPKRWTGAEWAAVTDKVAQDAANAAATAQGRADAAFNKAVTAAESAGEAQKTADGKNRVWYSATKPTGTSHQLNDLWYDEANGNRPMRWNGADWVTAQDASIAEARREAVTANAAAATAQGAANSAASTASEAASAALAASNLAATKGKVLAQATAPTGVDANAQTLWIDTSGSPALNTPKRWVSGTTWAAVTDKAATDAATLATSKGKVIIQSAAPATADRLIQNLWIDTTNGANTPKRWNSTTTSWDKVTDKTATDAAAAAAKAQQDATTAIDAAAAVAITAGQALTSANGKATVRYSGTMPAGTGYNVNDVWFDSANGNAPMRWDGEKWASIQDRAIDAAKQIAETAKTNAATAQTTADGKNAIYYQTSQPASTTAKPLKQGDMWFDTDDNYALHTYSGSAWVKTQDSAAVRQEVVMAAQAAADAQTVASTAQASATKAIADALAASNLAATKGKVLIQTTAPTGVDANAQTLWIDTSGTPARNTPKRWVSGTTWAAVTDKAAVDAANAATAAQTRADEAFNSAVAAATAAGTAQTAANAKARVWYNATKPAGTGHAVNDLWFDSSKGNTPMRWNGTDWVSAQDAAIAAAKSVADNALTSANGKNTTYYQTAKPTGGTYIVGDTWFDTDDNYALYTYAGNNVWTKTQDAAKALSDAKADATTKANAAEKAAIEAASADATQKKEQAEANAATEASRVAIEKANAAQAAALEAAKTYADAQATDASSAALEAAKLDATNKANAAEKAAITAAALDATAKKEQAEATAALDAKDRADEALRLAKLDADAKIATKTKTWIQTSRPALTGNIKGDTWIDTSTAGGNKLNVWDGAAWISVQDTAIATAQGAATSALTAANGKNKIIFSTSDASGTTGYTAGDMWMKRDSAGTIIGQWEFTTSWQKRTIAESVLGNLSAGKITSGTISADRIGANTIGVTKLSVADLTNLLEDPLFTQPLPSPYWTGNITDITAATDHPTVGTGNVLKITGTAGIRDVTSTKIAASPGDEFYAEVWVKPLATGMKGTVQMASTVNLVPSGNTWPSFAQGDLSTLTPNVWTKLSGSIKTPSNAKAVFIRLSLRENVASGDVLFAAPALRRKNGGELIVDGAIKAGSAIIAEGAIGSAQIGDAQITSAKIKDAAITNAKINDLNASKITAGTIAADRLDANDIRAKLITAPLINADDIIAKGSISSASGTIGELDASVITSGYISASRIEAGSLTIGVVAGLQTTVDAAATAKSTVDAWKGTDGKVNAANVTGTLNASVPGAKVTGTIPVAGVPAIPTSKVTNLDGTLATHTAAATKVDGWTATGTTQINGGAIKADTITAVQIAAKSLTSESGVFGAINAADITTGKLRADVIDADIIRNKLIESDLIIADEILVPGSITATNGIIGSIDAGKITAGAMDGLYIKANSIDTSKLLIGSIDNLVANPSLVDGRGWSGATGGTGTGFSKDVVYPGMDQSIKLTQRAAGAATPTLYNAMPNQRIPVNPGEAFYVSTHVWATEVAPISSAGQRVYFYDANGTMLAKNSNLAAGESPTTLPAGIWIELGGTVEVPADAVFMVPRATVYFDAGYTPTNAVFYMGNVKVYRAAGSTLITKGAVNTDHMTAGTIDGKVIKAQTISGTEIMAKTITVDNMLISSTDNFIHEADFSNKGTGWNTIAAWKVTDGAGRTGGPALVLTNTSSTQAIYNKPEEIPMEGKQNIRLSAWVKPSVATTANQIRIGVRSRPSASLARVIWDKPIAANTWTRIHGTVELPEDTATASFFLESTMPSGTLTWDYVSATRAAGAELIVDGSITTNSITSGGIDASVIKAGTLDAARIGAQSITAEKMVIGQGSNLLSDPMFLSAESNAIRGSRSTGTWVYQTDSSTGLGSARTTTTGTDTRFHFGHYERSAANASKMIPAVPGEKYLVDASVYTNSSVGVRWLFDLVYGDGTNALVTPMQYEAASGRRKVSYEFTVPAKVVAFQPVLQAGAAGVLFLIDGGVTVAKKVEGNLIVDGALTGKKITGALIETLAATNRGIKLNADGMVAYNNSGVETLRFSGNTASITGATIQTATTGARVVMDGTGLKAFPATGSTPYLSATGAGLEVTGTLKTVGTSTQVPGVVTTILGPTIWGREIDGEVTPGLGFYADSLAAQRDSPPHISSLDGRAVTLNGMQRKSDNMAARLSVNDNYGVIVDGDITVNGRIKSVTSAGMHWEWSKNYVLAAPNVFTGPGVPDFDIDQSPVTSHVNKTNLYKDVLTFNSKGEMVFKEAGTYLVDIKAAPTASLKEQAIISIRQNGYHSQINYIPAGNWDMTVSGQFYFPGGNNILTIGVQHQNAAAINFNWRIKVTMLN